MLDKLLNEGWEYHDRESERLAGELEAAGVEGVPDTHLPAFVHLATHTIGQHLRDWPRALALGRRVVEAQPPNADLGDACARLYVAAVMVGDAIGAAQLELNGLKAASDPLVCLLSMRFLLAEVFVEAGHHANGGRLFVDALAIAARIESTRDLERRIAASGNNLAWTLHELPSRTEDDVALMRCAAEASLAAWRRCGDWINEEQALYLNASVASTLREPVTALALAAEGLQVIAANGKRPFDAARFHLLRAISFAASDKKEEQSHALAQADEAAEGIAFAVLRERYRSERAKAAPPE